MTRKRLQASNDSLIEAIVRDVNYRFEETGEIYTRFDRGGHLTSEWRRRDFLQQNSGYRRVHYQGKMLSAHRIIYRRFKGELNQRLFINHIDGNRSNNNLANLELISQGDNMLHSYRVLGNPAVISRAKITPEMATQIRGMAGLGIPYSRIVKAFDLCKSSISYIVNQKTWKGVAS